jgi:signal peptidase I
VPAALTRRRIAIAAVLVLGTLLAIPAGALLIGYCKLWSTPSDSMAPTLKAGDLFVARMGRPDSFTRGDIILFEAARGEVWIQRVAGLPGDQVAMVDGILILNGQPIAQRFVSSAPVAHGRYGSQARRLSEQFPGEAEPHEIYDLGEGPGDDLGPLIVSPGHLFLLGDNRDDSLDSRYSTASRGVGPVPIGDVRGVPWFHYSRDRFGQPAGH